MLIVLDHFRYENCGQQIDIKQVEEAAEEVDCDSLAWLSYDTVTVLSDNRVSG